MLIDTHCHLNLMVKRAFNVLLTKEELANAEHFIDQARKAGISTIINVGTDLLESINCVELAQWYPSVLASVGIHPNDATHEWKNDLKEIKKLFFSPGSEKIVALGETGIDKHYPGYDLQRQKDVFKAHIELALELDKALIVHMRDAPDETLSVLEEFHANGLRGIIHCYSEGIPFATTVIPWGFTLGIGGTVTYPKNEILRETVKAVGLPHIVLETDAPYLPPQIIRGKPNSPAHIVTIAQYIAELCNFELQTVVSATTSNAQRIFRLNTIA